MKRDYSNEANRWYLMCLTACLALASCSESDAPQQDTDRLVPKTSTIGIANDVFTAEEWYPGGTLGTTDQPSYSDPTPAVQQDAGMEVAFTRGEDFFEHDYTLSEAPRKGLGPAWVRSGCLYCHPSYGHGKRQTEYRANQYGNGYLLVIYHPTAGVDANGNAYAANSYITEVTGMPQTKAMYPFKAPIDETMIDIRWKNVDAMPSGLSMTFPNGGDSYELIYPEVTIPQAAFRTNPLPDNYEVRLESTIGIYGNGLLDALDDDSLKAQHAKAARHATLNPAMWDKDNNTWAASAMYTANGVNRIKRFTYAMTRGSLQDGAGANAIWNITNVTRSDRHYFYTTPAWAKAMSEDEEVLQYIMEHGKDGNSLLHPFYSDGTRSGISERVNELLSLNKNTATVNETFKKYFVDGAPYNGEEEMSDKAYYEFMVWHRGLAVPAARNLHDTQVKQGKKLFYSIGCTACHRPSWETGEDNYWVDQSIKNYAASIGSDAGKMLPRYPKQKIWPYTDMVQHRLFMANDIRGGWCRTTPLWGRGLSRKLTGADDRLHDCRARTVTEAIMWHAYSKESDAYWSAEKFYHLSKAERDAIIAFIEAI